MVRVGGLDASVARQNKWTISAVANETSLPVRAVLVFDWFSL